MFPAKIHFGWRSVMAWILRLAITTYRHGSAEILPATYRVAALR
jgi:hypothetical protein